MKKLLLCLTLIVMMFFTFQNVDAQDIKVSGYMQTWLTLNQQTTAVANHPDIEESSSGFRIRRARLSFKSDINETFGVNTWFEFADGTRNLLDFYVTAKVSPELMFTIGQFITPCQSYETAKLSSSKIPLYELSDISTKLSSNMGHDSYRDVGMMISGAFDIVKYSAYYGNGNGRLLFATNHILNKNISDGLYGLRLDVEPQKGLNFGVQYSINNQDSAYIKDPVTSVSGIKYRDRSSFSVDLFTEGFGIPELFSSIGYSVGKIKDGTPLDYDGLTATIGYKITPAVQVIGRYDTYNQKNDTPNAIEYKTNGITFGANYLFFKEKNEIVKLGLNYQIRNEDPVETDNNTLLLWMQVKF
jgi:hypothetical protein